MKLSPNVTDIRDTARGAADGGADILSLINTFVGMAVDVERRRPVLARGSGGLSGPAIRPLAVWLTWQVHQAVDLPLIGMGGISTARDALEFILAGATAIQVGTANFVNPTAMPDVTHQMADWLERHGEANLRDLIGEAHRTQGASMSTKNH